MSLPIVVVTTTYYKSVSDLRYQLACETIRQARQHDYDIIVVDGSPDPAIRKTFTELGALVFQETTKGMGHSRRLAFFHALNHLYCTLKAEDGIIVWLEPEKHDLVRFIQEIIAAFRHNVVAVVPRRTKQSWETYPEFQQASELRANAAFSSAIGRVNLDVMFGPVAFLASRLWQLLLVCPTRFQYPDTYIQQFLLIQLLAAEQEVAAVNVNFIYPESSRQAETSEAAGGGPILAKRQEQERILSEAFRQAAGLLKAK